MNTPHNPDFLTPEQVGVSEGWRLLVKGEIRPADCEFWARSYKDWLPADSGKPTHSEYTYRTRAHLPESQPAGRADYDRIKRVVIDWNNKWIRPGDRFDENSALIHKLITALVDELLNQPEPKEAK